MVASSKRLDEKGNSLTATSYKGMSANGVTNIVDGTVLRNLTPLECERLQTLPEGYTSSLSDTQRYKTIGNGWTVDVIVHILKGIKNINMQK
ncbi:C-5 cytosine-specific DNA methylase [compost metagenome]